jgi:hypothetical protein
MELFNITTIKRAEYIHSDEILEHVPKFYKGIRLSRALVEKK